MRTWGSTLSPLEGVYDELIRQRRRDGLPLPGPSWMNDPGRLTRASCAADALLNAYTRVRKRSMTVTRGFWMLHEMLNGQATLDIARGAAMIRRLEARHFPEPQLQLPGN